MGLQIGPVFDLRGPKLLILAGRSISKLETTAQAIAALNPLVKTRLLLLDLSSQKQVRRAADEVNGYDESIDVLVNNAAVAGCDYEKTEDGLELQFASNHIGHFLLTSLLIPKLLSAKSPRVVNVTSLGYRLSPIRFHDYNFEGKPVPPEELPPKGLPRHFTPNAAEGRPYFVFCAYGQSKTANILHAVGLNEQFGGTLG